MPYTQEQVDQTVARVKAASIYDHPNQLAIEDCKVLLSALESSDQKILLHIQDHDDLMQHIAALADMGKRFGLGNHPEWVELISADIGLESNTRVIPMLNEALIEANRRRNEAQVKFDGIKARAERAEAYATKLEKAGDAMFGCSAADFDKACVGWDAARKAKP